MVATDSTALNRVYAAIADPTRRAIVAQLAHGEANIGELAARFPMTFGGVSKHVRILERAGLITRRVRGREHRLRLVARPLRTAADWLEHYRDFWSARLDALEQLVTAVPDSAPEEPAPRKRRRRR